MPIMRENIQTTELAFFKTYFLPLAASCKARSNLAKKEDNMVVAKPYDVLVSQVSNMTLDQVIFLCAPFCEYNNVHFFSSSLPRLGKYYTRRHEYSQGLSRLLSVLRVLVTFLSFVLG